MGTGPRPFSITAVTEPAVATEADTRYASWLSRLGGVLIDGLVVSLAFVIAIVFALATEDAGGEITNAAAYAIIGALFIFPALYHTLMIGAKGQTLGKMGVSIKVVDARDSDAGIGYGRAFGRWFMTTLFW